MEAKLEALVESMKRDGLDGLNAVMCDTNKVAVCPRCDSSDLLSNEHGIEEVDRLWPIQCYCKECKLLFEIRTMAVWKEQEDTVLK